MAGVKRVFFRANIENFTSGVSGKNFSAEIVLPVQVKNEIHGHFNDPEKNIAARRARILWAEMLIKSSEVNLDKIEIPKMHENILGPDSKFDKQLIAYAMQRATEGAVVYIATEDGGIMAECAQLFKNKGLNIFTKATRTLCKAFHKPILDEFRNKFESCWTDWMPVA